MGNPLQSRQMCFLIFVGTEIWDSPNRHANSEGFLEQEIFPSVDTYGVPLISTRPTEYYIILTFVINFARKTEN